jgi:hypothetical protein
VDGSASGQGTMNLCEYGNEPSDSMKTKTLLEQLNNNQVYSAGLRAGRSGF